MIDTAVEVADVAVETPAAPVVRACLVEIGGGRMAVDVLVAREVAVFADVTRVPCAPAHLLGVANLRGAILPVVDVRPVLGLAADRRGRGVTALVVEEDGMRIAVVVEAALGLESFSRILPSASAAHGDLIHGLLPRDGELIPLLDLSRVLHALDSRRLGQADAPTQEDWT